MCPRASVRSGGMRRGAPQSRASVLPVQWGGKVELLRAFRVSTDSASLLVHFERGTEATTVGALVAVLPLEACRKQALQLWLGSRPSQHFDVNALRRLGFLDHLKSQVGIQETEFKSQDGNGKEETDLKSQVFGRGGGDMKRVVGKDEADYEIKRVVFSSGADRRFVGRTGPGYFASSTSRGGPENFWPIQFHTIRTHRVLGHPDFEEEPGSSIESDVEVHPGSSNRRTCSVELVYSPKAQAAFLDALDNWCVTHGDKFFSLRCPGHRGPSSAAVALRNVDIGVFTRALHGQCLRAAVANGIHALTGPEEAMTMLRAGWLLSASLSKVGEWLGCHMRNFGLQRIKLGGGMDEEEWLRRQTDGIFLVRLAGTDSDSEGIDHVIVVDAKRQLVLDCIERFALHFTSDTLNACVGDDAEFLCITELRRLFLQKVGKQVDGKKKRKCRKVSAVVQQERKRQTKRHQAFTKPRGNTTRRIVEDDE